MKKYNKLTKNWDDYVEDTVIQDAVQKLQEAEVPFRLIGSDILIIEDVDLVLAQNALT